MELHAPDTVKPTDNKPSTKCNLCKQVMTSGVTYKSQYFHTNCFLCENCGARLAGLKVFNQSNRPYCCECFEQLFAEKCQSCGEAINGAGDILCITFDNKHWHPECFTCLVCQVSLVGSLVVANGQHVSCTDCAA